MFMRRLYDEGLAQAAYLVGCQRTGEAIVFDPERDIDRYLAIASENDLRITAVAETHIHADFLSGARELAERVGAKVYVSDEGDADWKYAWLTQRSDGGTYDHQLLRNGDRFRVGNIQIEAVHTPGHTPEHLAYLVTDLGAGADEPIGYVTGDFVFVGDLGRPDLLETAAGHAGTKEGSARRLFQSVRQLDRIPEFVQIWPAHGAGSACGKALGAVPVSTMGYERRFNPAIQAASSEERFVDFILTGQPDPPLYFARMKHDNKVGPRILGSLPRPRRLHDDELVDFSTTSGVIIDTRSGSEFRDGHVPGSVSLPLDRHFSTDAGSFLAPDVPLCVIADEEDLDEAVRGLVRVGLDRIEHWYPASEVPALASHDLGIGASLQASRALESQLTSETPHAAWPRRAERREGPRDAASKHLHAPDSQRMPPRWLLGRVAEITAEEATSRVDEPGTTVLDVRTRAEFESGHVPNAQWIPHTRIASRLDELDPQTEYLVVCRTGRRSARTAAFLQSRGFSVINVNGGMEAWNATTAPRPVGSETQQPSRGIS